MGCANTCAKCFHDVSPYLGELTWKTPLQKNLRDVIKLMLIIAIVIRLTSSGPCLYGQERMGLDGRTFNALKFRSMHFDAESETGAEF